KGKTVIRAGFGRMYERVQGNDMYNMLGDPPFAFAPNVSNVLLSNPSTSILTGQTAASPIGPAGITVLSYGNYKSPVSNQWSFSVQHQLFTRGILSLAYVGNVNNHQSVARDINTPFLNNPLRTQVAAGQLDVNLIRPYPGFAQILQYEDSENSSYHSLQTSLRIEAFQGLTLQLAYTFSKAISETPAGTENNGIPGTNLGQLDLQTATNPYNLKYDKGLSAYDRTNVAVVNYIYELPFLKGSTNKPLRTALGGWQLSGITTFESGLALTPLYDCSSLGLGPCGSPDNVANRPSVVGPITYPKTQQQWFNPAAFTAPAPLQFGTSGKGILRGPGMNNWNLSMFKDFRGIPWFTNKEGADLQFRVETFNTFNHTQFDQISLYQNAGGFGSAVTTFDPRVLQFGLKFKF
ncbi:MAG: hypothetical protein JO336_21190, partial [Acidobacteriia bacterium]|nr:hypothetical protein [Terriglobia bacterium]